MNSETDIKVTPDTNCSFHMMHMNYDEANELLFEMSGLEHRAEMSTTNTWSHGTLTDLLEAMDDVGYTVSFRNISFRDIQEITRMPCMSYYPDIVVSVETTGRGRGFVTVFEGTMSELAAYSGKGMKTCVDY